MNLYSFIFIKEKEGEKSQQTSAASTSTSGGGGGDRVSRSCKCFFITLHCHRSQILSVTLVNLQHLDQLFLEFHETEISHLIIFVCNYFIMILY